MPEPIETPVVIPPAVEPPAPSASKDVQEAPAETDIEKQSFLKRLNEEIAKRKTAEDELKRLSDVEAERKKSELSELDRLKLENEQATAKAEKAEKELADQRASIAAEKAFAAVVTKLNLTFANDKAREHVFKQMDVSAVEGYEEAVKKIMADEPYYFKEIEIPELDATVKSKGKNGVLTDAQKAELKKRFRIK